MTMSSLQAKIQDDDDDQFQLDETQIEAIDKCIDITKRIVAVTGAAGTGKTTILQNVYRHLYKQGRTVVLCAPTGKAAKRITEATGIQAVTIHRLLEYPHPGERNPDTGKALVSTDPKRDRNNPLDAKVILVDEYAMVNVEVHRNLLDAMPNGGVIRMFGDANQLQPIETNKRIQGEPSSFLKMLDKFDGIRLETIHRQADGSNIISNGNRIIVGNMPKRAEDFDIKITEQPVEAVLDFIQDNLANEIDYGTTEHQIISPTKVGWVGCEAMNSAIQQLLQPSSKTYNIVERHKWVKIEEQRVYQGDKVIFTVNNYPLDIFNGETGIIESFTPDGGIVVNFGDKTIAIPVALEMEGKHGTYYMNPQKDLDLAYVITTHKSQGSEYNRVCYIMNKSRSYLLNRKNLYTAISRARTHVTIITDARSIDLSLYKKGDT
jgi:exodeoxyribonuclease V alpha subunit|tara:strand:- start:2093 stop:3394 length:1302 start_codon:yes stop_codon:yes gene_type:complete